MKEIEAFDMLVGNSCERKSLPKILEEMGFNKESYMVVHRQGATLKIGDSFDNNGCLEENKKLSFGGSIPKDIEFAQYGNGSYEVIKGRMNDFEAIDRQMTAYARLNSHGDLPTGMTGSNNGLYAAMAFHGDEFILTKDPEIARQLEEQLGFKKDQLGVPLSNGGVLINPSQRTEWAMVEQRCKQVVVERARGTVEPPKKVKSPFRDNTDAINKDYAAWRAQQLQGR